MLYQHVTDESFEIRIKELVCPTPEPELCSRDNVALTFEEEYAVCYVRGYVFHLLEELTDQSSRSNQDVEEHLTISIDKGANKNYCRCIPAILYN